nr:MAG TPA: Major capsid protein [Caudoviricetes sp.]
MANVTGLGTTFNLPNYTGELFQLGQKDTPFLNLIGGISGGNMPVVESTEFALNQNYKLEEPSQPEISEAAAAKGVESTHYKREQETNVVQIFQRSVNVTYSKLGNSNAIAGINVLGQPQPVRNEKDFQIQTNLQQIAKDANYTFLKGEYKKATANTEANKTRGVLTAIKTNVVTNSSPTELKKDMLDELFRNITDDGFDWSNAVLLAGSYNKQLISKMFAYVPQDRNIGGANIKQIETDFGNLMVIYEPLMKDTVGLFNMNVIKPVFRNIVGKGAGIFYEDTAKVGAADGGQLYGEMGIDYGAESFHGKITGLTTAPSGD